MNGLWWLSSNCGAKNRLHRIPLDKSVFSCEAQRNPCPSLGCLSNLDNPRHIKLHLSLREPRSSSAPQMDFIFWPCHQFTHDLHRPETSVSISPVSPDYRCVLWRTERPQRTTVGKAEMNLSSTMDCRCHGWSGMKHYNLAPVMRSDRSLCSRAKGGPKLLAVATTLPLSSRHGGPCVLRAVSLMVPWALCGTRDPHALHRVVTLSEKCTAESSWMVPSAILPCFSIRRGWSHAVYGICSGEIMGYVLGQRSGKSSWLMLICEYWLNIVVWLSKNCNEISS